MMRVLCEQNHVFFFKLMILSKVENKLLILCIRGFVNFGGLVHYH